MTFAVPLLLAVLLLVLMRSFILRRRRIRRGLRVSGPRRRPRRRS